MNNSSDYKVEVGGVLVVEGAENISDASDKILAALYKAGITILPDKKFEIICVG